MERTKTFPRIIPAILLSAAITTSAAAEQYICNVVQPAHMQPFGQVAETCTLSPSPAHTSELMEGFLTFYNQSVSSYNYENMPKPAPHETFYYLTIEGAEASGRFEGCMGRREAAIGMLSSRYLPKHYHTERQTLSALPISGESYGLENFQSTAHANSVFLTLFNRERAVWTKHFRSPGFPIASVSISMDCTKIAPEG